MIIDTQDATLRLVQRGTSLIECKFETCCPQEEWEKAAKRADYSGDVLASQSQEALILLEKLLYVGLGRSKPKQGSVISRHLTVISCHLEERPWLFGLRFLILGL